MAPVATGMGVALCLMALKRQRPGSKYVIWSRVDQKSCFKAILTAGLEPVIMSLGTVLNMLSIHLYFWTSKRKSAIFTKKK